MSDIKIASILLVAILICISIGSSAQKLTITDEKFNEHKAAGDKLYQNDEYYEATIEYLKASKLKPNDPHVAYLLGESYRKFFDYDNAELWYKKVHAIPNNPYPYANFYCGLMEKLNGKYLDAEASLSQFMKSFQPKTPEDKLKMSEAEFEYKGCVFAIEQLKKPIKAIGFEPLPVPVNSKFIDYAPMIFFHDSSIVITSSRKDAKGSELNLATGEARSDNFRFEKIGARWDKMHNNDGFDIVNTTKDDGAGELTRDQNKYYYTICDGECAIFVSKKVNGKFSKPEKLNNNINARGYWNAQPTLSPTADTMFFVSKRSGGKGLNDIWMSINKDKSGVKEDWGAAINLVSINTPFNEVSPFWDDHTNTIYFASDGHAGFGGLDIYAAVGSKRDSIVNLGLPYNSNRDDFYYNLGKEKGYLSSNRKGGLGHHDVYWFNIHPKESIIGEANKEQFADAESITSTGKIMFNDTQTPANGISVYLKDDQGNVLKEAITDASGEFKFSDLPADKSYKVVISENDPRLLTKVDYQVAKRATPATPTPSVATGTAPIQQSPTTSVPNTPKAAPKATPTPTPTPKSETEAATTPKLAANKAPAAEVASPKAEFQNPASVSNQVVADPEVEAAPAAKPTTAKKAPTKKEKPRVSEEYENTEPTAVAPKKNYSVQGFSVKPSSKKPSKFNFENIYFDFNSNELTNAGRKAMDDLVSFYGSNKEIQIEIKAYSDGYGDPTYNKQLAEQRGRACFDYLAARGVDQTNILLIPVGADNFVGGNFSYIGRQLNRRVEFNIVGGKGSYQTSYMTYVVEPKLTIFSISKMFGMTQRELKEVNGIDTDDLKAYSTIRVKRGNETSTIAPITLQHLKEGVQEFKFQNMQFVPAGKSSGFEASQAFISSDNMYVVQPSETLFSIAKRNGMSVEELMQINELTDNNIRVGQKLKIRN